VIGAGKIGTTVVGLVATINDYQLTLVDHSSTLTRTLETVDGLQNVLATRQRSRS
jgi:hypothetical protein